MNKLDVALKVIVVGLLGFVAYQQASIQRELEYIGSLTDSIRHIPDHRGTISVEVVNGAKAPIPVSIANPASTILE